MAYAVSSIVHKIEDKVFDNPLSKYVDPVGHWINQDVQANAKPLEDAGARASGVKPPPVPESMGATPAVADETAAAGKKKAQRNLNQRRQGSGASGSTLITGGGDEDQLLEKSTLLGL